MYQSIYRLIKKGNLVAEGTMDVICEVFFFYSRSFDQRIIKELVEIDEKLHETFYDGNSPQEFYPEVKFDELPEPTGEIIFDRRLFQNILWKAGKNKEDVLEMAIFLSCLSNHWFQFDSPYSKMLSIIAE